MFTRLLRRPSESDHTPVVTLQVVEPEVVEPEVVEPVVVEPEGETRKPVTSGLVLDVVLKADDCGVTWVEVSEAIGHGTKGQVTSALSRLDASGKIIRLPEKRGNLSAYVSPALFRKPVAPAQPVTVVKVEGCDLLVRTMNRRLDQIQRLVDQKPTDPYLCGRRDTMLDVVGELERLTTQ